MGTTEPFVYRPAPRVGVYFGIALLAVIAAPNAVVSPARLMTVGGLAALLLPLALMAPLFLLLRNRVELAPTDDGRALRVVSHLWTAAPREARYAAGELVDAEVESTTRRGRRASRVTLVTRDGARVPLTTFYSGGDSHLPAAEYVRAWIQGQAARA